jgi:hypothetical protein
MLPVTVNIGDDALVSEYKTTRDSWKIIQNLILQLPSKQILTTMSTKDRPVTDAQNDATLEYKSVCSLPFKAIFAPVSAVTLSVSDLGRITNGRDGNPDEERPFLFSFSKPKVMFAWRETGAMLLTRACLKHPNARSVAGDQGPDKGNLGALAATHKKS